MEVHKDKTESDISVSRYTSTVHILELLLYFCNINVFVFFCVQMSHQNVSEYKSSW